MKTYPDVGLLLLRLYFGLAIGVYHGILNKLSDLSTFTDRLASMDMPAPGLFAVLAGLAQSVGGLMVAFGVCARLGALFVLPTVLFAAVVVHWGQPWLKIDFALTYVVAMATVALSGAGRYTLTSAWTRQAPAISATESA